MRCCKYCMPDDARVWLCMSYAHLLLVRPSPKETSVPLFIAASLSVVAQPEIGRNGIGRKDSQTLRPVIRHLAWT
jgi:hypothetical protein